MYLKKLLVFLLCIISYLSVLADVPYTFTQGQPANAEEVNANFSTLVSQIEQLQTQIAELSNTPTVATLAGTYDFIELRNRISQVTIGYGFDVLAAKATGTLVLNANGTGSLSTTENERYLSISSDTRQDATVGDIETTMLALTDDPSQNNDTFTWTLTGNKVVVNSGGVTYNLRVGGGNILIGNDSDDPITYLILIAVRR